MDKKALRTIEDFQLINKGDKVVIGLSGGPDSMALFYILKNLRNKLDFDLVAGHVNHGVRGEEALRDQEFVREVCKREGIEFFLEEIDMVKMARKWGISPEEAGRKLRYGFFRRLLKGSKGKIAVAHNLNDQAETLLMRFIRGTGLDGLGGMEYRTGDIIRPILNCSREEIEDFIDRNKIETVLDHTNLIPIYTRNKIRLDLIPYLEENFNPNIINSLWRTSNLAREDRDFLNSYAQGRLDLIRLRQDKGRIEINKDSFNKEDRAIRKRIIRLAIEDVKGDLQGIGQVHIDQVLDLFSKGETGQRLNIIKDIIGEVSYNRLIIKREDLESQDFVYNFVPGEDLYIEEAGLRIESKLAKSSDLEDLRPNYDYCLDFNKLSEKLVVRNRRPGDRFRPLGMKGSKKLKDFFIDEKIPREKRDKTCLLLSGDDLALVIGHRLSEDYKTGPETEKLLFISYKGL